ncbi:derlin-2.2 [Cyclospora cayetanensis]|uniref:Derlin n=2 Tax=Cyclospora cayetanensis TaxID=88456 RepID=A0A6P6RXU5_9EIME|nr:derlin-2.2 [Cyclospora cayetanensis]
MDPTMGTLGGLSGAAAAGPEAWYLSQPPITRAIATATFVLTLLTNLGLLPVELLMLDWSLAIFKLQIWRLFTTLLYVGRFSLGWVFHMYMWLQVSGDLESNAVFRQASKGAYLLFVLIVTLITSLLSLLVFWPSGVYFHGEGLLFACLYYWSRREAYTPVSVSFLTVQGYQLPFLLLLLHLLMGRDLWLDAFGLAAGHAYYFLREILPAHGGPDLLTQAPKLLDMAAACVSNAPPPHGGGGPSGGSGGAPRFRTGGASVSAGGGGATTHAGGGGTAWGVRQRGSTTQPFSGRGYTLGGEAQR